MSNLFFFACLFFFLCFFFLPFSFVFLTCHICLIQGFVAVALFLLGGHANKLGLLSIFRGKVKKKKKTGPRLYAILFVNVQFSYIKPFLLKDSLTVNEMDILTENAQIINN